MPGRLFIATHSATHSVSKSFGGFHIVITSAFGLSFT